MRWLFEEAREEMELIEDHRFFRDHGVLPSAGGKGDQPARFIATIEEIDLAIAQAIRDRDALKKASGEIP